MAEQSKKKVAVVTGASRGIGRAIALELASRGAAVVINYNGSEERAKEVKQTIEENELAAAIDRFLYAKPKLNRNIFVRRYYHLYAIRDIADAYGMSESKVTSLLFRMRNELRRFLEKEGIML